MTPDRLKLWKVNPLLVPPYLQGTMTDNNGHEADMHTWEVIWTSTCIYSIISSYWSSQ